MKKTASKKKSNKKKPIRSRETAFSGKLFQNLRKAATQFISGRNYQPLSTQELLDRMHLPEEHLPVLESILSTLVEENLIEMEKDKIFWKARLQSLINGTIRMHKKGFGFVAFKNADGVADEVFVPRPMTGGAVDGDVVEILITGTSEKGKDGKVVSILERSRTHIAGIIVKKGSRGDIIARAPLFGPTKTIHVEPNEEFDCKPGDRLILKVTEWGNKETPPVAEPVHFLGSIHDAGSDVPFAVEAFELRSEFPASVLQEVEDLGNRVKTSDLKGRLDLREEEIFTIDPDTAKDFDDALSLEKHADGSFFLGVHIADVSHYVKKGSNLDLEARRRGNSTYFPGYCLPMLPKVLSENLCSLREAVQRLTVSVFMHLDAQGNVTKSEIVRSVIKSQKRMTYKQAKAVLEGKKTSPHAPKLKLMEELCHILKKQRKSRGALELSLPELIVKIDEKGEPSGTEWVDYDITHQMVEEFMLKANETIAQHIDKKGKELPYRVHEEPSQESLKDFSLLVAALGFNTSEVPSQGEIQDIFDEASQTALASFLASHYIRRMRLAVYSENNVGHWGLALTHYCHFTSPIRRFADLLVHRILFDDDYEKKELSDLTGHCSERERLSSKAEMSVLALKKLRLLDQEKKKNAYKSWEAVISNVRPFGFSFEIKEIAYEGFFHVTELQDDYYIFDESNAKLRGRHSKRTFALGSPISLHLNRVDLIEEVASFELVSERPKKKKETKRSS